MAAGDALHPEQFPAAKPKAKTDRVMAYDRRSP